MAGMRGTARPKNFIAKELAWYYVGFGSVLFGFW